MTPFHPNPIPRYERDADLQAEMAAAATQRPPTLVERLRTAANRTTRTNADVALLCEAALQAANEIERLRKELRDQEREFQREARAIAAEARMQERLGGDYGATDHG